MPLDWGSHCALCAAGIIHEFADCAESPSLDWSPDGLVQEVEDYLWGPADTCTFLPRQELQISQSDDEPKLTRRLIIPLHSGECMWCDDGWPMDKYEPDKHVIQADGIYDRVRCTAMGKSQLPDMQMTFGPGSVVAVPDRIPPEIEVPVGGELLADSSIWINRFTVPSESSDVEYVVSQHRRKRYWACSCKGCKNNQHCKHLTKLGLPGDHTSFEARVAITAQALPKTVLKVAPGEEVQTARPRRRYALPDEDV